MDYGCFRIESKDGVPLVGTYPYPYSLTLEAAAEALEQLLESPPELGRDPSGQPHPRARRRRRPRLGPLRWAPTPARSPSGSRCFSDYI